MVMPVAYSPGLMTMWPISMRVNTPESHDATLLESHGRCVRHVGSLEKFRRQSPFVLASAFRCRSFYYGTCRLTILNRSEEEPVKVKCFGCNVLIEADDSDAIADAFVAHGQESHTWS